MNYHVFIVNNTTFQYHLRYGFAGTGAGNREVSFLPLIMFSNGVIFP